MNLDEAIAEARPLLLALLGPDRFEAQDSGFFERVIAGYAARRAADPGRWVRLDARPDFGAVWQQVQAAVSDRAWA